MQQSNAAAATAFYDHAGGGTLHNAGPTNDAGDAVMARWLQSAGLQHLASPLADQRSLLMQVHGLLSLRVSVCFSGVRLKICCERNESAPFFFFNMWSSGGSLVETTYFMLVDLCLFGMNLSLSIYCRRSFLSSFFFQHMQSSTIEVKCEIMNV